MCVKVVQKQVCKSKKIGFLKLFYNIHLSFSALFLLLQPLFWIAQSCLSSRWMKVHENRLWANNDMH